MTFPDPVPGLVIRYSYLWTHEAEAGREEGVKDRPCAVVMTVISDEGRRQVVVAPVAHSAPPNPADAIEIPADTKNRLHLDFDRSWIVVAEVNEFTWPGPDLRPIPGRTEFEVAYGILPPRFYARVRDAFLERYVRNKLSRVKRTE